MYFRPVLPTDEALKSAKMWASTGQGFPSPFNNQTT